MELSKCLDGVGKTGTLPFQIKNLEKLRVADGQLGHGQSQLERTDGVFRFMRWGRRGDQKDFFQDEFLADFYCRAKVAQVNGVEGPPKDA